MRIFFCSLIVLCLVSCSDSAIQTTSTLQPLATLSTNTSITATAITIELPTPASVALQSDYVFPAWLSDPETNILAALITNDNQHTRKISFINPATSESYDIPIPDDVSGYFWYDKENFGLLSQDLKSAARINLQTGSVIKESISSEATQYLNPEDDDYRSAYIPTANALEITTDSTTGGIIFGRPSYTKYGNKSKSGRFSASWSGEDNTRITVMDNKTHQIIWDSGPFEETYYGTLFRWSPKDESQLAFLQGKLAKPESDLISETVLLTVVDVVTGEVLGRYGGNFGLIVWSLDGRRILYEGAETSYQSQGVEFKDAPCILFLELGEKRCLKSIPRLVVKGYQLVTTGVYTWSPNRNSIFYTYIYKRRDKIIGNLCVYDLVTGHINCPVDKLDALKGMTITNLDISPDAQFIHFCYSAASILNDYADISNDSLIKADGTGFFSWAGAIHADPPDQTCSHGTLWRPLQ